jgi:FixJ family two-component response regulator
MLPHAPVISIVDDDKFVRESLRRLMKSLGYRAFAHPSADDFLKSPYLRETSCLIADVQMPRMTGADLFRHLSETGRAIPTIFITAYPDDGARARALRDGAVCYLTKPFKESDLLRGIQLALERKAGESDP